MYNPLVLAHHAVDQPRPQYIHGEVSRAQPLPATFNDPLHVVIPQWQPDYFWTFTDWPADHGNTLPVAGTECLLAFDDQRNLWLVRWKGAHS